MPAAVETAAYANKPAWHGLGNVIDTGANRGMTIEEALRESGLDWTVRKVPSYAPVEYKVDPQTKLLVPKASSKLVRIPDRFNVQRESDNAFLGTVGSTWQPVQNVEGFRLVDDLIALAGGQAWVESAMSLNDGRKVVVMVHLDNGLQIAGEQYASYLAFVNGHDGRTSVTAMSHDERIVCANTLDIAVGEASKAGRIIRVRHTTKATDRIKEAAEILNLRNKRAEELAVQGEWLAEQTMTDGQFMDFLSDLMPIEDTTTAPHATMISARRAEVADVYMSAPNLQPIKGTKWGALQAVIEYTDHRRSFQDDETRMKAQMGFTPQPLKQAAWDALAAA